MKKQSFYFIAFFQIVLVFLLIASFNAHGQKLKENLILIAENQGILIGPNHPDVLASNNKSGFETGQVIKIGHTYHMFVNEMFDRPHRDMRISYWESDDAVSWKRISTIKESIPGRTASNPRSEVWLTAVEYNEDENCWNIFYVAYRAGDASKTEIPGSDYEGQIWRAKSVVKGLDGIAGPYADMEIILKPDSNSQNWEGQQAIASFNPYKVGQTWYALYDGHNYIPKTGWPTGMAFSKTLSGPWKRMPDGFNPLNVVDEFMENPVVSKLKDGRYLMVFDSFGDRQIGYSFSDDGLHWTKEKRVAVQSKNNSWAQPGDHYTRTPLCAIEEENGTFTVIYTAVSKNGDKNFYAIGKCTLSFSE